MFRFLFLTLFFLSQISSASISPISSKDAEDYNQEAAIKKMEEFVLRSETESSLEESISSGEISAGEIVSCFLRKVFKHDIQNYSREFVLKNQDRVLRMILEYCAKNPKETLAYIQAWIFRGIFHEMEMISNTRLVERFFRPRSASTLFSVKDHTWSKEDQAKYIKFCADFTKKVKKAIKAVKRLKDIREERARVKNEFSSIEELDLFMEDYEAMLRGSTVLPSSPVDPALDLLKFQVDSSDFY